VFITGYIEATMELVDSNSAIHGDQGKILYTPDEAAAMLRVSVSWLKRKAGAGEIPSTQLGRRRLFSHADLEAIVTPPEPPAGVPRSTSTRPSPSGVSRRARRR
jgi:excisionase family DNA binding protein